MSNYRVGADLERRVQTRLEDDGYVTLRSAGSKTPVDIAAFKVGQTLFVQVKRDGKLPTDEWNALFDLAVPVAAIPVLATTPKRGQLVFYRLTARRAYRSHHYPCERFETDEAA